MPVEDIKYDDYLVRGGGSVCTKELQLSMSLELSACRLLIPHSLHHGEQRTETTQKRGPQTTTGDFPQSPR